MTDTPTFDDVIERLQRDIPQKAAMRKHFSLVASGQARPRLKDNNAVFAAQCMVVLMDHADDFATKDGKLDACEWLHENLGNATGALTGTDKRSVRAAEQVIEVYAYTRSKSSLDAFRLIVSNMQKSTQWFAYHIIAKVMDWPDRPDVWAKAGLPPLSCPGICKHEP